MRLDDLDYHLPPERIAQVPAEPRDSARLLVDRGSGSPLHATVRDLGDHLTEGDLLVVNDTRVIPARLRLRRGTGGEVEVLLLEALSGDRRTWEALVRPARKLHLGERLFTESGAELVEMGPRTEAGDTFVVTILGEGDGAAGVLDLLGRHGETPLPPYLAGVEDPERYQTVYARDPASSAAPTAGLHFTDALLGSLQSAGIGVARVELVVGLDTFKPVTEADPTRHRIHSERFAVPAETLDRCAQARRVVAVGTTSVRALESAAALGTREGRTRLFIHRPYDWKLVDLMMTNFHMPRTTLLMMIDAFVGPRWRSLYELALTTGYRFLSFGDAMLLDRRAA